MSKFRILLKRTLLLRQIVVFFLMLVPEPAQTIVLTPENQCRILSFFPTELNPSQRLPNGDEPENSSAYPRWTQSELHRVSHSFMATARLALEHFHTRNPVVVPELAKMDEKCTVELSLKIFEEHVDAKRGGQIMLNDGEEACALLGTYNAQTARAMQPTSVSLDLPQVIYYTIDPFFASDEQPAAVGMPPTILPRARALAEYLNTGQVEPAREYVALIYEEAYPSSYMTQCFQEDAADKYGLISTKFQDDHLGVVPTVTPEQLQRKVLLTVRETGIRTIFLNKIESSSLYLTAQLLEEYDMLTDEYVYIFTPQAVPTDAVGAVFGPQQVNSPLDKLLRGGVVMDHVDPFRANPETDPFLAMWKSQGAETLRLWSGEKVMPSTFPVNDGSYFQTTTPADYASFLYDAIISIGMGACHATTTSKPANDTSPFRSDIYSTNFTGASGRVEWGCYIANRCNDPLRFGMFNIRAVPVPQPLKNDDGTTNTQQQHTYKTVLTALWDEEGRWQKVAPFIYRHGDSIAPEPLCHAQENNYLSPAVRGFGMFLYLSAATCSLAGLLALVKWRRERIVTRSQPFFLACMCLGSLIMSTAILTLSFDESLEGISDAGLDRACMASVWSFFVGHVLGFAALFSKLWRLDRVMQFRRGTTSRERAMIPMLGLVAVTVLILILWTVLDPYRWEREWISQLPAETYGRCRSDHFWAFFGPLMAILVVAEGLTVFFSFKTANVSDELNDTGQALNAVLTQFHAWVIGIPILAVLKDASADAVYVSRALLIWIFSISSVLFVVGSRIHQVAFSGRGLVGNDRRENFRRGPSAKSVVYVNGLVLRDKGAEDLPPRSFEHPSAVRGNVRGPLKNQLRYSAATATVGKQLSSKTQPSSSKHLVDVSSSQCSATTHHNEEATEWSATDPAEDDSNPETCRGDSSTKPAPSKAHSERRCRFGAAPSSDV